MAAQKRLALRPSPDLAARLDAHVRRVQRRASEAGVPAPAENAIVLALLERGLDAYAATFGEAEERAGEAAREGAAESSEKGDEKG